MNKKALLVVFLTFLSLRLFPQLIDNKLNLYISHWGGTFTGNKTITDGSFVSPSLYANYDDLKGLSLKALVKRNKFYSLGISLGEMHASGWKNDDSSLFNKTSVDLYSLSPVIQFHTPFAETGIMNRLRAFAEIAPNIGLSDVNLAKPIFEISGQSGVISAPKKSSDTFAGISSNIGLEVTITRVIGLSASYSFRKDFINSSLYSDKNFSRSGIDLGLFFRFKKDKLFY